ncbi:sulfotransferase domain-containing protein [Actinoplanes sp. LDG1-06]|uniref:Sulfotransferase domain-containing protein n=1 Tax=Paractinoplanes ovalisporus TaxID=2810368 RepID=A0ABS2AMS2_9ACTN|nr:sulfotransferase domain-containing protein [Actinoplanes ovalisporus]MBM2621085.1 sulfotransferase domain-containing protein [Actinoplanes ovalisporus]
MFNSAVMYAKQHLPEPVRVLARRGQLEAYNARLRMTVPVATRADVENIYHCAVRKTASQWIKEVFSDSLVYKHSGLLTYDPRFYGWKHPRVVPPNRIGLSLFFPRARFDKMPKPEKYRAFFVMRDPRDMVVSSYFSTRNSHGPMGDVLEQRKVLMELPRKEGMLWLIGDMAKKNRFGAIRSWVDAPQSPEVKLVKYEDLTGDNQSDEMAALLSHCGINLPPDALETVLSRYSFAKMNERKGTSTVSHYRKGQPGDWANHFDDDIYEAFNKVTGDLVERLGYPSYQQK